jgi:prolyl oligopeptidase PreP (S9A serine peptidase family)
MFARLKELNQDVRYYENIEGGHGGAANNTSFRAVNVPNGELK